jgi:hypothetical protein
MWVNKEYYYGINYNSSNRRMVFSNLSNSSSNSD